LGAFQVLSRDRGWPMELALAINLQSVLERLDG